ncbi:MAG: hypothetical protein KDA65_11320, partial [Planctomycetaceae bacterium]|nr:hypothetical protein [Planctomycetaceae bacterium]
SIADWQFEMDLLGWAGLAKAENRLWGITVPLREWKQVLKPEKKKTLNDLAEFIASKAARQRLRPLNIAGTECLASSAFLTVKQLLHKDGVDVRNISPSTPLHEFVNNHFELFYHQINRLAPGVFQHFQLGVENEGNQNPVQKFVEKSWFFGVFVESFFLLLSLFDLKIAAISLLATLALITIAYLVGPTRTIFIWFKDIYTFRDLSERIAALQSIG